MLPIQIHRLHQAHTAILDRVSDQLCPRDLMDPVRVCTKNAEQLLVGCVVNSGKVHQGLLRASEKMIASIRAAMEHNNTCFRIKSFVTISELDVHDFSLPLTASILRPCASIRNSMSGYA